MKEIYESILEHPSEFLEVIKKHFSGIEFPKDFDVIKNLWDFDEEEDEITFTIESDPEGTTWITMGYQLGKTDKHLRFREFILPYVMDSQWDD